MGEYGVQIGVLREQTQHCPTCKQQVPLGEYPPSSRGKNGKACRSCLRAYATRKRRARGVQPKGEPWTPEKRREYNRQWAVDNPRAKHAHDLKRYYGMTLDDYDALLAAQGGVCAACKEPETRRKPGGGVTPLHVDHCHETNVVRGLLCTRCNFALGYAKDDPAVLRALADYLEVAR